MAVVNFYDDIFETVSESKKVKTGTQLRSLIEKHADARPDKELHEVYNTKTGETEYIDLEINSYKVVVIINGIEGEIDYKIKKNDVISVIFVPEDSEAQKGWGAGLQVFGWAGAVIGTVMEYIPLGPAPAIGAAIKWAGTGIAALGNVLYKSGLKGTKEEDNNLRDDLPYIDGASNQSQLGQRYLSVLGKHLISPTIIGTPYHETHTTDYENERDGGQWIKVLYCAGYGPLRLTNFKLGDQMLAYNESSGSGIRRTVMHGQLKTYDHYEDIIVTDDNGENPEVVGQKFVPGDFTLKWKNNDVKLEIIQAGHKIVNKYSQSVSDPENDLYGTVYPQAVHEYKVNSNVLFAYDKELAQEGKSEPAIQYYNRSLISGYRTNTVRFTANCPERIEVELDMPNGVFGSRQEGKDSASRVKYYNIPIFIAVQWRFAKDSNNASDAENGEGWETFDVMKFDSGLDVKPITYTSNFRRYELETNKGLSKGTSENYNENWLNKKVFDLTNFSSNVGWEKMTAEEIIQAEQDEILYAHEVQETYVSRKHSSSYPYVLTSKDLLTSNDYTVNPDFSDSYKVENCIPYKRTARSSAGVEKENYNTSERRLVFSKYFTDEDLTKMVNYNTTENYYDYIEVRVVRLTPCYIAESSGAGANGPFEYQDLVNWTYLRTFKFDKQILQDKLDNGDYILRKDLLCRPQPIKTDLDDFVYIALSMKQDASDSAGNTIENLSCIAESFTPKYDSITGKWTPENINEKYEYYHKYQSGDDWKIDVIDKSEYDRNVVDDQVYYFKRRKGNDFSEKIKDLIFGDIRGKSSEVTPMFKLFLPEEFQRMYISSNTASVFALSLLSRHLNEDAKTYDAIDMAALSDFYEFCEDVKDGTKQKNNGIAGNLATKVDLTGVKRYKTGAQMQAAGWPNEPIDGYSTILTHCWYQDDTAIVFTPIYNDGSVLSEERVREIEQSFTNIVPNELIMARFSGQTCLQQADYYSVAAHQLSAFYYENNPQFMSRPTSNFSAAAKGILEDIVNTPINALKSGVKKDKILQLIELGAAYDNEGAEDISERNHEADQVYYPYYLMVLEQSVQAGQTKGLCAPHDEFLHVKFECNGVLNKDVKLESLLQKILLTGRSNLKRSEDNKYAPLIGRPDPYPATVINQRNCIGRSNTKNYDELPSGFQVSLIDADDNYSQNDLYIMDDGEDYHNPSARIEPFTIDYVTDKNQIACLARFNLACRLYQLESYSRTVGMIGHSLSVGETVLIQDDTLLIGTDNGARIVEILEDDDFIYGFTTDEPIKYKGEVDEDGLCTQGCTIVQPNQTGSSRCVTLRFAKAGTSRTVKGHTYRMTKGLTNFFLISTLIQKYADGPSSLTTDGDFYCVHPEVDNLVAFGNVGAITSKAVIMGIKPKGGDKFDLSLVPYNEDLYEAGFGFPIFLSNMTNPDAGNFNFDAHVTASDAAEVASNALRVAEENVNDKLNSLYANHIVTLYKKSKTELKETGITTALEYNFATDEKRWESAIEGDWSGWVFDVKELENTEGTLYVTSATAFGRGETAFIDKDKWSTPVAQSRDGINTATIFLYQRCDPNLTPNLPEVTITYDFYNRTLDPPEALGNWVTEPPENNGYPLFVTIATISNVSQVDEIEPSEWTSPTIMANNGKNGGYQDYMFLVGDIGMTDDELLNSEDWTDAPAREIPEGKCLYMATAFIEG